ncbi:protein kinase [Streptomyces sp. NPDC048275]|uniref:serine/threonine-protein kinase n=1 Tax=Streptomyces sp. NPDC048275 TaxID=3155629 RepID=UPI0033D5D0FD
MSAWTETGQGEPRLLVGRYRLTGLIGQGGMGRVWRAVDEMLSRDVAIKEMRLDSVESEDRPVLLERTLREARATARIDHPHVVRVYDVVHQDDRLWIVMELVIGRSLEQVLVHSGPLNPWRTARIGRALAAALRAVHAAGVLHRDIKPGNVLLERKDPERIVLTDFGIAAIQDTSAVTMAGMLIGSPEYMAPERVSGRATGPASDLWSLGATLYAAVSGHSPFRRTTTLATLHAVLYEEPEFTAAAGPLLPILTALLRPDPELRPTPDEVIRQLSDIIGSEPSADPSAEPAPTPVVTDATAPGAQTTQAPAEPLHATRSRPQTPMPTPAPPPVEEPTTAVPRRPRRGRAWLKRWWNRQAGQERPSAPSVAAPEEEPGQETRRGPQDGEPPTSDAPPPNAPEPDPSLPRSYIPRKPVTAFAQHSRGLLAHHDGPEHEGDPDPEGPAR